MIDVLVPYYGDPALARLALTSVLRQDVRPARVIVVDDAYPDAWLESWLNGQPDTAHVTYLRNRVNLGIRANFAKLLDLASAEYVVMMGSDDVMHPGFVGRAAHLVSAWERPEVVQMGVRVIDENGNASHGQVDRVKGRLAPRTPGPIELSGESLAASLLAGNWTYFPSLVWKREVVADIGFRDYSVVLDLALLMEVICTGGRMIYDPCVTFDYRRHGESFSSLRTHDGQRFAEEREFFRNVRAALDANGWRRASRAARWHWTSRAHAMALGAAAVRRGAWAAARDAMLHALSR